MKREIPCHYVTYQYSHNQGGEISVKNLHLRDCEVDVILHVSVNAAISNDCEQQDQPTSTEFRTNMKSRHFQASEITIIVAYGVWFYSENSKQNESERRG